MPLNKHVGNVIHLIKLIIHRHTDTTVTIIIITRITRLVLIVQRHDDLCRHHTQICHLVLTQFDVHTLVALAIDFHAAHTINLAHAPLNHLGIIIQLLVALSIALQRIEHAIHIAEVVPHLRCRSALRQFALRIRNLTAQHIPLLLHFIIRHCGLQLHRDETQVRITR